MQSVLIIVLVLVIMAAVIGGTWLWLAKAVKDTPNDLPVLGDESSRKKVAEKTAK